MFDKNTEMGRSTYAQNLVGLAWPCDAQCLKIAKYVWLWIELQNETF